MERTAAGVKTTNGYFSIEKGALVGKRNESRLYYCTFSPDTTADSTDEQMIILQQTPDIGVLNLLAIAAVHTNQEMITMIGIHNENILKEVRSKVR